MRLSEGQILHFSEDQDVTDVLMSTLSLTSVQCELKLFLILLVQWKMAKTASINILSHTYGSNLKYVGGKSATSRRNQISH